MQVYGDVIQSSRCGPGEGRVEIVWIDPDTGGVSDHEGFRCVPYGDLDDPAPVEPAWPPSAHGPARDSVAEAIPDRVVQLNPFPRGMTGMATWLWYDDDGDEATAPVTDLSVTAAVPGVSVTATAAISSFCWDVDGDGVDERCTDRAGTEQQPGFTHVYESTGTYPVRLTVTWAGSFAVNGVQAGEFQPVRRTYTVDYPVIEVRSVLVG